MSDILTKPALLVLICAIAYAGATFAMKSASVSPSAAIWLVLFLALGCAVGAEIMLLQRHTLGITYITILGAETLLVLVIAFTMGEGLGPREVMGAALVLAGTAVIWA